MRLFSPIHSLQGTLFESLQRNRIFSLLFISYGVAALLLFLYSFTQIDLNLTLLSYPILHAIQEPFMHIGYYDRPLSTFLFSYLLLAFSILYVITIIYIHKKRINAWELGALIVLLSCILLLSYPALSHDIFNYMFDAKIYTHYGDNPYLMRALDYPQDPWVRFMHWTHRTYPYGPVFLPLSIALSFIGMNIFPFTLLLFKAMMVSSYIGSVYFLYKILQKKLPQYVLPATAFFALNPLVILETLVSAHHDMVMMFLALVALYLFLCNKKVLSFVFFLLSVGIKYVTIFMSPLYVLGFNPLILFVGGIAATSTIIYKLGLQPWYLLWILPFASLLYKYRFIRLLIPFVSLLFLLRYLPFLYTGEWPADLMVLHTQSVMIGIAGVSLVYVLWLGIQKRRKAL